MVRTVVIAGLVLLGSASRIHNGEGDHDAGCKLRGVWNLEARSLDGKDLPVAASQQWKILTNDHFMWIRHAARRDTLKPKTEADTLRAFLIEGGAGRYTTSGNLYTEHNELYDNPSGIGTSFVSKCRVDGDRWYQSFTFPNDTTANPGPIAHWVEVWRRIE